MPNIAILNQETIDKIAAGEVVERPCSVVKELVENAIDAGSTAITVEIKEGGISFIRITDNGCGIERDQVAVAFYRHSTSKIRSAEDLLTVKSLGFRGEALSSISAVARVELITKTYDELTGTRYVIEGSKELSNEEIGAPDGTTFIVKDLFYNVPARRKFLKTAQTEGSYIALSLQWLYSTDYITTLTPCEGVTTGTYYLAWVGRSNNSRPLIRSITAI
jgi:DNA mismatch repair protein MutL